MDSETPKNLPSVAGDSSPVDESQKPPQQDGIKLSKKERNRLWFQNLSPERKEVRRQRSRKWTAANKLRKREYDLQYAATHRDQRREIRNRWGREARKKNPELWRAAGREAQRKWRAENLDYARELTRKNVLLWRQRHPERQNENSRRTRAIIRGVTVDKRGIAAFITNLRNKRRIRCFHCGKWVSGKGCHIDHITLIARGGKHEASNLGASCPKCNLSKGSKILDEWNKTKAGQLILL